MIDKFIADEWKVIEEGFDPKTNRFSESIFSLGNEHMGLRGFFEETYSGDSLQGIYVAGVYYPDKTRVGWWKIGYPEFFAKVINSTNWIGINIEVNGVNLDLAKCRVKDFRRELDMKQGKLTRSFIYIDEDGKETSFIFTRFLSMAENNIACISVQVTPLNYDGKLVFTPYLDGDVKNEDANYGEKFWDEVGRRINGDEAVLTMRTKKTGFVQTTATTVKVLADGLPVNGAKEQIEREKYVGYRIEVPVKKGSVVTLQKFVAVCTSRDVAEEELDKVTLAKLNAAVARGYDGLFADHVAEWDKKWAESDVVIEGDVKAQQGIRYNIFQLNQTYTGKDPRLNIGPKGFTGEKYGGSTYWDTEAFCFPFYLYTNEEVARNLLYYRYLHLERAKENAAKLGFKGALYPMVTMDGQECHNEWEITFEEIHRNAAIAYAIYNYTNYTGKKDYLYTYGIEVLVEISRFWADRVNYHPKKDVYMILGVTGPNEYENNVNNNWYTNTMASWCLEYTMEVLAEMAKNDPGRYEEVLAKLNLNPVETEKWADIVKKMYYPCVEELGIFEQNDGYMDKEQMLVKDLPPEVLPLNKHWSWDRILRSCFIKQADTIQGLYFLPERFDLETMRRNFDFYEPRTVHESSLSPSIYSIVASWIGYKDKAVELYLRTARLDLDNYNDDTDDGIHLTSMAGTWSSIVQGFAGVMVRRGTLTFKPYLPDQWQGYSFKFTFRGRRLEVVVSKGKVEIRQLAGEPLTFRVFDRDYQTTTGAAVAVPLE
ncbi:MAG TPA: glycoside hydrolase family 65 protein [Firmicutes bacterium]|jgi:maltose phosphorylase|nr:glycoside hydrolase family 65 protein [Bacillota bacterium]HOQ23267.1 family 65 glycosyl hydrolase domain-containing protein [Bacillota bacterium]HPT66693.1 family 65 glycosyl hydrolase domain-containing protein [Bacillota bacterium]